VEFLNRLKGDEIIPIVAIVSGILCAIISTLAYNWRRVRVAEMEASLKQQMLEKGMSAAEIAHVMGHSSDSGQTSSCKTNPSGDRGRLVKALADNGMSAQEIERVLRAMDGLPDQNQIETTA
jgi:hypothetical protein